MIYLGRANGDTVSLFELSIILLVAQNLIYTPTLVIHAGKLAPLTLNWGIISGDISTNSADHLPIDPASRNTRDGNHEIAAKALRGNHGLGERKCTTILYGTTHVLHHCNAKHALWAGKHVLLEKPVCLEVEELDELIKIVKRMSRFFMGNDAELCELASSSSFTPSRRSSSPVFSQAIKITDLTPFQPCLTLAE
ncbi:hypothetical protein I305_04069 [Cryptococcus gattii E566]|nr:hypothetical protein I305_04069 [Cryptococcus gattii E566]